MGDRGGPVSALTRIAGPAADRALASLVTSRSGAIRWLALRALIERSSALASPLLGARLRDRDGLVVFAAVDGLRRLGTSASLDALEALAANPRTAPGTREAALDAIEATHVREGRSLQPGRPARLIMVFVPSHAVIDVVVGSSVDAALVLARVGATSIFAPGNGRYSTEPNAPTLRSDATNSSPGEKFA